MYNRIWELIISIKGSSRFVSFFCGFGFIFHPLRCTIIPSKGIRDTEKKMMYKKKKDGAFFHLRAIDDCHVSFLDSIFSVNLSFFSFFSPWFIPFLSSSIRIGCLSPFSFHTQPFICHLGMMFFWLIQQKNFLIFIQNDDSRIKMKI